MQPTPPEPASLDPSSAPLDSRRHPVANVIAFNILIVVAGLIGACAAQFVIAPLAIGGALAVAAALNITAMRESVILLVGANIVFNGIALVTVAIIAALIKRIWLLQGWIIGALIGFLLYSACFGLMVGG